jgi:hypothetical protein
VACYGVKTLGRGAACCRICWCTGALGRWLRTHSGVHQYEPTVVCTLYSQGLPGNDRACARRLWFSVCCRCACQRALTCQLGRSISLQLVPAEGVPSTRALCTTTDWRTKLCVRAAVSMRIRRWVACSQEHPAGMRALPPKHKGSESNGGCYSNPDYVCDACVVQMLKGSQRICHFEGAALGSGGVC